MKKSIKIIRSASKGIIDSCILPGTSNGAEILWLYSMQWKGKVSALALGLITLVSSHMMIAGQQVVSRIISGPENTM